MPLLASLLGHVSGLVARGAEARSCAGRLSGLAVLSRPAGHVMPAGPPTALATVRGNPSDGAGPAAGVAGSRGEFAGGHPVGSGDRIALTLRLDEPVLPDARLASARPVDLGCRGSVPARWPGDTALEAGSVLRVEGRWIPDPRPGGWRARGVLVVAEWVPVPEVSGPTVRERLRTWLARRSRELYGARAGTVEALVVNRRAAMPSELRERYARAGLVHILSISGFHVGVIVGWLALLLGLANVPPGRRQLWAAAGALPYVAFLDWPAPATRAVLLATVAAIERARQRKVQPVSLLGFTCLLVLLLDPWALADPGAWLSALALWGAMTFARWSDRALGPGWHWRTLFGSLGATLATAPLTAALFGTVSVAGIGLNFAAIPLAALAVPGLFLSLLVSPFLPALAERLAAGAGLLLAGLDQLAWWGGGLPHAYVVQPIAWTSALPWAGLLGVALWCVAGRPTAGVTFHRWAQGLALAAWCGVFAAFGGRATDGRSGLALHFLDVGQGDAAVLRTPAGHWVVVDAGPRSEGWDAGRRVVAPFLAARGAGRIAVLVLSHPHADHLGGAGAVLERFPTDLAIEPAELVADPLYTEFLDQVAARGIAWQPARPGLRFELDSVRFTLLHPDTAWAEWRLDLNEDSAVLLVEYGGFRALLTGDAGLRAEARLRGRVGRVAVLKVGHHGSRSATGQAWLEELRPAVAVVSSGAGNRYGHPHPDVLARLAGRGISVWRTDREGTISVWTDGREMEVTGRGRRGSCPAAAPAGSGC